MKYCRQSNVYWKILFPTGELYGHRQDEFVAQQILFAN